MAGLAGDKGCELGQNLLWTALARLPSSKLSPILKLAATLGR
jgi:hypothetical protein